MLLYGITSKTKKQIMQGEDFLLINVVFIDIKKLKEKIENGLILIDFNENNDKNRPYLKNNQPNSNY